MKLSYDIKKLEIRERLAVWASRPDADFARYQMTRQQAIELLWATSGRLAFPWDGDYKWLHPVAYPNFESVRPAAIGSCETLHDVKTFLRFIRDQRQAHPSFQWVTRAGGHSTAGYSTVEGGLMLDVRGLRNLFVEPQRKRAHVGPGVDLRELYRTLHSYGLFAPGGICPDVRIGGMVQGGGFGFCSRMFGMSCDAVTEVELVLASGQQVVANERHNRDLFWAVRGGTGNQFGVLTRVTYQLFPLREIGAVLLQWRLGTDAEAARGAAALELLQRRYMGSNGDRRLGYQMSLQHGLDWVGPYLIVRVMHLGEPGLWRELLAELTAMPGCQLVWEDRGPFAAMNDKLMGYEREPDYPIASDEVLTEFPPQEKQTRYFDKPLGVAGWRQIVDLIRAAPATLKFPPQMVIEPAGAAINERSRGFNAYVHRRADFNTYLNTYWDSAEEKARAFAFMDRWLELGAPWSNGEAYQNYPKSYYTDWARRYWAEYYPVLCLVKRKYDPTNVFRFEQSIGSDGACPDVSIDDVEQLVPEIVRSLREPIVHPEEMDDEPGGA